AATVAAGAHLPTLEALRPLLGSLARVDENALTLAAESDPPAQAATIVVGDGIEAYLPLAGLIDTEKELERLDKQLDEVRAEVARFQGRPATEAFAPKPPANIIEGAREQLRTAEERLHALEERRAAVDAS